MEIIRNCPHCGASCSLVLKQNLKGTMYTFVQCDGCRAQSRTIRIVDSTEEAQAMAITLWNRRDKHNGD
ncbi:MAG: Lar family restriction alleviation protein [Oscillospiraceae bacterium]|nr:Lar family restriction alleviation protein [Oscillospiraceae bacterium]